MEGRTLYFCAISLCFLLSCCLAVSHSTVKSLPGFQGTLPFELETGYVSVGELEDDIQLFYYFVKSERNPNEDPLILWNIGGPGCSGVSGFDFGSGPLRFEMVKYHGSLPTLVLNPHSWTKVSNIIYIDSPVGTGFSYSTTVHGSQSGDIKASEHVYQFLKKWLIDHPEFLSNPVYIGGDSYGGKIAPVVTLNILNGNDVGNQPFINLNGYILGNPMTTADADKELNMQVPYAHGMGLISDELYESAKRSCGGEYIVIDPKNLECLDDVEAFHECTSMISFSHILDPKCGNGSPKPVEMFGHRRSLNRNSREFFHPPSPLPEFGCKSYNHLLTYYWLNDNNVRKALHIREGTVGEWVRCNSDLPYTKDVECNFEYHVNLSKRGIKSLVYSGDHDMLVPHTSTQAWIRSLNYSIVDEWRPWLVYGQVGGYTRTYSNNMTFVTVKGAGHVALEHKPEECAAMFKRWISQKPI